MQPDSFSTILTFLPLFVMSATSAIAAFLLAREKGRNVTEWTILAAIPFIGVMFVWFFVGAANLKHEKKLDKILEKLAALDTRGS